MFAFARRAEPQRRPLGVPGLSEEQYERAVARVRAERATFPLAPIRGQPTRLRIQPSITTEGTTR